MLNAERLFSAIGLVDDDLVEAALAPRKKSPWLRQLETVVPAACLLLMVLAVIPRMGSATREEAPAASAPASSAPAASAPAAPGSQGPSQPAEPPFMSSDGPVLPLLGLPQGVTAERTLTFDFQEASSAQVEDVYTLTNTSDQPMELSLTYPVTGSLSALDGILPALTLDGAPITTVLSAGDYAGGFVSAYGSGDDTRRDNLLGPTLEDYQALLQNDLPEKPWQGSSRLDEPVTVYAFGDYVTDPAYDAATLAMDFTIDPAETSVLTYGLNGSSWDDASGWRQYSFFVPNGKRMDVAPKLVILRGADIEDYTMTGYTDSGCEDVLDTLSCSVERYETTIGTLLEELCRLYLADENRLSISGILKTEANSIPLPLYYRCAVQLLLDYGPLSHDPVERYEGGRLDEILSEALITDRIFYSDFTLTLEAGETAALTATAKKRGSFDFPGGTDDRRGVYGYDFLTGAETDVHVEISPVEGYELRTSYETPAPQSACSFAFWPS